ncbi:MAG: sodium-dependent transporter [Gemmatimonadales bacterium]
MTRASWSSRVGFVLATAGFAIGLGNIWRFPYLAGTHGGGAFVIVYVLLAILVGIPLMTAEISMGRKAQATPILGMRKLTGKKGSPWNAISWLGLLAAFLIESYYFLILGWAVAYAIRIGSGRFTGATTETVATSYTSFIGNTGETLLYALGVMVLTGVVVSRGLRQGVEAAAKWLMPVLFVFLIVLAIGSLTLPGAAAGLAWYLKPDWSQVTPGMALTALGQVFFSIGISMAAAFVYGSYVEPKGSDVPGGAATVVAFDTLAALIAGLVIFPAVFAFNLPPDSGPGLLFVTMANVFARAPLGAVAGAAFFVLVFVAGFTSVIAVLEALASTVHETWGVSRQKAIWGMLAVLFVVGLPSALSFGPWSDLTIAGKDFFSLIDWIAVSICLPIGGLLIALYVAWVWGFDRFRSETNEGADRITVQAAWGPVMRYLIPVAVLLIVVTSLGLF